MDVTAYASLTTAIEEGHIRFPSATEILDQIKEAQQYVQNSLEPPTIKVWVGNGKFPFSMQTRDEYPKIMLSEFAEDDSYYIAAGIGVICGKSAYDKIWEYGYIAVWTDEVPK
jgi:hypothetical protein